MEKQTLTVRQAAIDLGVRLETIYSLIWAGKLTAHKENGCWRIPAVEIAARKARG